LWVHDKKKELGVHPIQRLFMDQIHGQLKAMHAYALQQGKANIALAYQQALSTVQPIHASKYKFRSEELSNDPVSKEIDFHTKKQFHT
jgi:hypothetical protein